jgi:thiol-disulfide isomerase/thioredoxin
MRFVNRGIIVLAFLFSLCLPRLVMSRDASPVPPCVTPPGLRSALRSALDDHGYDGVAFDQRIAQQAAKLNQLVDEYPNEAEPQRRFVELAVWVDTRQLASVQERFRKQAIANPSDPLALFAYGYSLSTTDADAARETLTKATLLAPKYPWPYLALARLYSEGKTADASAMATNVGRFFTLCPNETDRYAKFLLARAGTDELRKRVASQLRVYLDKQSALDLLTGYETLWGLEFQTHSPTEFDRVRAQVSKDLKRLETVNQHPDAEFQALLIRGYKLSGASKEVIREKEDRLLTEYPRSHQAFVFTFARWRDSHKEPEDQTNSAEWAKYDAAFKSAQKGWVHEFTDDYFQTHYAWTDLIEDDEGLSNKVVLEAFENDVRQAEESQLQFAWPYINAAEYLLRHNLNPEKALEILEEAKRVRIREQETAQLNANRTAEEIAKSDEHLQTEWWGIVSSTLEAARQLNRPELVLGMRAEVEAPLVNKKYSSWYWMNRARLARVDRRTADALVFYQLAHQTSTEQQPTYWHGKIQDRFADEVKPFWKELGGTDVAWEVWLKPVPKGEELTEGRWEKATKPLASFELTDLTGKIWRSKDVKGKALLVNLWATWCGPCRAELPHVQKLYEMTKSRDDIVVLSFNVDEDPGLVGPFVTEQKFGFPVLLALNFAAGFLNQGIPQTLIVDPDGNWRWTQIGFGEDAGWETTVLNKLESVKSVR